MRLTFNILLLFTGTQFSDGLNNTRISILGISSNPDDILFYFYPFGGSKTKIQYNNFTSLAAAHFNSNLPTVVLCDGFLSHSKSAMPLALSESFPKKYGSSVNTIFVDLGALSGANVIVDNISNYPTYTLYPIVVNNAPIVGRRIAEFIKFLGVNPSTVRLVGLSLGAHIMGMAGAYAQKIYGVKYSRISGLDPSGPLVIGDFIIPATQRLGPTNAAFVDVYHTNMGQAGSIYTDTGMIDIFVNGGISQPGSDSNPPGCGPLDKPSEVTASITALMMSGSCSHQYAWKFFNYTIFNNIFAESCDASVFPVTSCFQKIPSAEYNPTLLIGEDISSSASGKYRTYIDNAFTP